MARAAKKKGMNRAHASLDPFLSHGIPKVAGKKGPSSLFSKRPGEEEERERDGCLKKWEVKKKVQIGR